MTDRTYWNRVLSHGGASNLSDGEVDPATALADRELDELARDFALAMLDAKGDDIEARANDAAGFFDDITGGDLVRDKVAARAAKLIEAAGGLGLGGATADKVRGVALRHRWDVEEIALTMDDDVRRQHARLNSTEIPASMLSVDVFDRDATKKRAEAREREQRATARRMFGNRRKAVR